MKRAGLRGPSSHHPALSTRGETHFVPQDGQPSAFPQASVTLGVGWLVPEVATKVPQMTAWGIRTSTFYMPRTRVGTPPLLMLNLRRVQRGNEMPVRSL